MPQFRFTVNGKPQAIDTEPERPLLASYPRRPGHRNQVRLRRGSVPGLYRHARRTPHRFLHDSGARRCGKENRHYRRPRRQCRSSSRAAGVPR